ncbi:MAG: head GIN domain-containing protein [Bacteroidales bacterium]
MKTTNKILLTLFMLILISITIVMVTFRVKLKSTVFIEPSGQVVTNEPELPAFNAIDVSGRWNMTLEQSETGKVVVQSDDNLTEYIRLEVKDQVLEVSFKGWTGKHATLDIHVSVADIESLIAANSARIEAIGTIRGNSLEHKISSGAMSELTLDFEELILEAHSGAHTILKGMVGHMVATSSAGSEINASGLQAGSAELETSSGSRNELFVTGELSVDANSGSIVNYTGNPVVRDLSTSSGARVNPR